MRLGTSEQEAARPKYLHAHLYWGQGGGWPREYPRGPKYHPPIPPPAPGRWGSLGSLLPSPGGRDGPRVPPWARVPATAVHRPRDGGKTRHIPAQGPGTAWRQLTANSPVSPLLFHLSQSHSFTKATGASPRVVYALLSSSSRHGTGITRWLTPLMTNSQRYPNEAQHQVWSWSKTRLFLGMASNRQLPATRPCRQSWVWRWQAVVEDDWRRSTRPGLAWKLHGRNLIF